MSNSKLEIRFTVPEDAPLLTEWLSEPNILRWFPMIDAREIEDAVKIWIGYAKYEAAITALWDGEPCGMSTLYLQPYKKFAHQCLFSIIAKKEFRGKGVGTFLLENLMKLAKEKFRIEILHLEVYEGNPAINLYRRVGFEEFGKQDHFIKENGEYLSKTFMQKYL